MSLDQLLVRLRQAWVVQRQQIQVILGALFFLVCIVCWEKSQWTQPARSDLLHNLPQSAHLANLSASDNSALGGSNSDSVNAWSCKHSRTWFRGQGQRWPELEELADTYCQLALSSEPEDDAASPDSTPNKLSTQANLKMPDLVARLQDKLTGASVDLSKARQVIRVLCERAATADPSTLAACQKVAALPASGAPPNESVDHLLKAELQPTASTENGTLGSMASFQEYRAAHPNKAVLGLTGIMSCPRFTTFVLWLSGHDFQMANVKQVILHRAEKAPAYARTGLRVLRCPFFGVVLFMCMPGFQTELYVAAFKDQQPYLAMWLGLMGLLKMAVEGWAFQMCFMSPMAQSEKLSSAICSHVLLPAINVLVGVLYVCAQSSLPAASGNLLYFLFITVMPLFTVWAGAAVWVPRRDHAEPRAHQAVHRERRGRDVLAAAAAALENHRIIMQNGPGAREAAVAAAAMAAGDLNTAPHRHRDAHRHKEVHWPPPLLVPDHLEDSSDVPDSFKCPITFAIMKEPATTRTGLTYDRPAIMKWIEQHRRDPTTSLKLKAHHLSPNLSLRSVIQNWVDMQS